MQEISMSSTEMHGKKELCNCPTILFFSSNIKCSDLECTEIFNKSIVHQIFNIFYQLLKKKIYLFM